MQTKTKTKVKTNNKAKVKVKVKPETNTKINTKTKSKNSYLAIPSSSKSSISIDRNYLDIFYRLVWKYSGYRREYFKDSLNLVLKKTLPSVSEIWSSYNSNREDLAKFNFGSLKYSYSYMVGFTLSNVARFICVYDRVIKKIDKSKLKDIDSISIWDIGCGSAAISSTLLWNILNLLKEIKPRTNSIHLDIHLVDRVGHFLDISKEFIKNICEYFKNIKDGYSYDIDFKIHTHKCGVEDFKINSDFVSSGEKSLSIYLAGYLYNELSSKKKGSLLFEKLMSKAFSSKFSLVFLLDSANQTPSKKLMELNEKLIVLGFSPLYPCSSGFSSCPLLSKKDWCYTEGSFKKDPLTSLLDKALKINRSKIASSAFVLTNQPLLLDSSYLNSITVVGKPVIKADPTQSHIQYLLCDGKSIVKKECPSIEDSFFKGELYTRNKKSKLTK